MEIQKHIEIVKDPFQKLSNVLKDQKIVLEMKESFLGDNITTYMAMKAGQFCHKLEKNLNQLIYASKMLRYYRLSL